MWGVGALQLLTHVSFNHTRFGDADATDAMQHIMPALLPAQSLQKRHNLPVMLPILLRHNHNPKSPRLHNRRQLAMHRMLAQLRGTSTRRVAQRGVKVHIQCLRRRIQLQEPIAQRTVAFNRHAAQHAAGAATDAIACKTRAQVRAHNALW